MKKIIISLTVFSFFLFSCGNTTNEKPIDQGQTTTQSEHQQSEESELIKLNNGEKWLVNEEMKPFIFEAEIILNEYIKTESNDYTTLVAQLKEKNSGLIKSCTMKGESHDELHKWLHPHIALIKSLEKAENPTEAQSLVMDLKNSFETYNKYFQ